jgi:hypothetical protein
MEEKVAWLDQDEEMAKWTEKENENISQYWGCFGRIPGVNDIKRVKVKRAARKELLDREDEVLLHSIDHAYEEEEKRRQQQLDEAHEWTKANELTLIMSTLLLRIDYKQRQIRQLENSSNYGRQDNSLAGTTTTSIGTLLKELLAIHIQLVKREGLILL